ncbi:ACP S-malonyltransferase [Actinomadura sp. 1N219]|uniref:ACP S-malonyltransferase n=1 Tax=Actinomadura sp. 1N219 TaxID=3375152 RepID=UPI00378C3800
MDTAIVFPAIKPFDFADVARFLLLNPAARRLVARADETLGYSLIDRFREDPEEYSEAARVAFMVTCLALAEWAAEELGTAPGICAGPSFGGTPAAVYAGSLDFSAAVAATAGWGRRTADYFAREHRDVVTQSFARVPEDRLAEVLLDLDERGGWYDIACHVDDDFHMLSVHEHRLDWLKERLRAAGGLPLYTMRPPMHSAAFAPLRDVIELEVLDGVPFADPQLPIVCDHDGTVLRTAAEVRTMLLDAVVRPVRWPAVVRTLREADVRTVHVSGPDDLWGRVSCTTDNFEVVALKPEMALRPRRRDPVG